MEPDSRLRAEFLERERYCASRPDDIGGRRHLLELFILLGQPEDLPGASLTMPPGSPPLRVAALTPYFQEPLAVLERCHRSVRQQTVRCDHILVADGFPRAELDGWPARHLRIQSPTRNFGDTPRRIAGEAAIDAGFDAVVYLDADNWLRSRHVESLVACHLARGTAMCHSARTQHRIDGTLMPFFQRSDNNEHVDTSCLLVTSTAFDLLPLWGTWPRELSRIDDRMFWHTAMGRGYSHGFTGALTTSYQASHIGSYRAIGELPPRDVRPDIDLEELFAWWAALPANDRDELDRRWRFSVSSLVTRLRAMRG